MLTPLEKDALAKALRQAESNTGASVAAVVTPLSDSFIGYALLDSFLIVGLINIALYMSQAVTSLHYLLLVQLVSIVLAFIPFYRRLVVALLPSFIRHHHAARSAVMAFHQFLAQTPAEKHAVLFYVSLSERYVHVLHSRSLTTKVDEAIWQDIINQFTLVLPKVGLSEATLQAIKNIENILML